MGIKFAPAPPSPELAVVHNRVDHQPEPEAVVHNKGPIKRSSDRHKDTEERRAYKREWMRRRRAAGKDKQ